MTTVTFFKRADGALTGFQAVGHAEHSEAGTDIVCAEISALTQAALHGLKDVLKAPVMFELSEALVEARLLNEASERDMEGAQLLLVTLLDSLEAIRRDFPLNVRVIFKERR